MDRSGTNKKFQERYKIHHVGQRDGENLLMLIGTDWAEPETLRRFCLAEYDWSDPPTTSAWLKILSVAKRMDETQKSTIIADLNEKWRRRWNYRQEATEGEARFLDMMLRDGYAEKETVAAFFETRYFPLQVTPRVLAAIRNMGAEAPPDTKTE